MPNILKIPHPQLEIHLLSGSSPIDETAYQSSLFSCESHRMATMKSEKRRREYLRRCYLFHKCYGHEALCGDEDGVPVWPREINGSLSHKAGHIVLGFDRKKQYKSIGIDLEAYQKIHVGLFDKICTEIERKNFVDKNLAPEHMAARIFSAKESIYKCIFPLGRRFFYFQHAETVQATTDEIVLKLLIDTSPLTPAGTKIQVKFQDISIDGLDYVLSTCQI